MDFHFCAYLNVLFSLKQWLNTRICLALRKALKAFFSMFFDIPYEAALTDCPLQCRGHSFYSVWISPVINRCFICQRLQGLKLDIVLVSTSSERRAVLCRLQLVRQPGSLYTLYVNRNTVQYSYAHESHFSWCTWWQPKISCVGL